MERLAIFVSGSGTNMENLVREIKAGRIGGAEAALVVSDNPEAKAIQKALALGVDTAVVDRKNFSTKAEFEVEIIRHLEMKQIGWIALAGFMRILSPGFVRRFGGRILNIHPSLLPAFPGAHGIRDAWEAGTKESGATVHFVDEGVDTGVTILQKTVARGAEDTLESFEAKIHAVEYEIYPEALRLVFSGKVRPPVSPAGA